MTPEQKDIVRETWKQVETIAEPAASLFYGRLFELDPTIRPLFGSVDMVGQGNKLMTMIGAAVAGLEIGRAHV